MKCIPSKKGDGPNHVKQENQIQNITPSNSDGFLSLTFNDFDEVIRRANDTPFGLAGGVFTKDLVKAHSAVKKIEAGIVYINNYNTAVAEMPWGGYKFSGKGHENGLNAIRQYTKTKTVYVEMGNLPSPY